MRARSAKVMRRARAGADRRNESCVHQLRSVGYERTSSIASPSVRPQTMSSSEGRANPADLQDPARLLEPRARRENGRLRRVRARSRASERALDDQVGEVRERVEPDYVGRIRDEVRERVHIVEGRLAGPSVDQVLDPAEVESARGDDPLRVLDDGRRRVVALDRQPASRDAVGEAGELAVVGRAEVEGAREQKDPDRVQELASQDLDAHDRVALGRELLLKEERSVDAAVDFGRRQLLVRRERLDPGAAPADVRLHQHRILQPFGGAHELARIGDHSRARMSDPERGEQRRLARLGQLELVRAEAVQDTCTDRVEVGEVVERVEDGTRVAARPRRRAHPVDDERVRALALVRIEREARGVHPLVRHAPPVELGEQRLEPLRVLVEDRDGLLHETGHLPVYYFPEEDARADLLTPSEKTTHCPFKGDATYRSIRVGDRVVADAVWAYSDPIESAGFLRGHLALFWKAVDEWLAEDTRLFGHPRDPFHRIDVWDSTRHVRVLVGGEVVAESRRAKLLAETALPPRYYLPLDDVRREFLEPSQRTTVCAYKGTASYWHVRVRDELEDDLVWTYREPGLDAVPVRGLVCFFNERIDLELDGVLQERPRTQWSR